MTPSAAPIPPGIPAATLILLREPVAGPPLILMAERSKALAFAGGALVFPGGRTEAADEELGEVLMPGVADAGARVAAIRETLEEVGLLPTVDGPPPPDARARLLAGESFDAVLGDAGLTIRPDRLVPWSRWHPDLPHARVFDTRFFVVRAPEGEAIADGTETAAVAWMTAADVLGRVAAGAASAIFPTRRNLERLARHGSVDAVLAHARATPPDLIRPWVENRDGVDHLCLPDGLGYPITAEPVDSALRG